MKNNLIIIALFVTGNILAQPTGPDYSRVKVLLHELQTIEWLHELGIAVDHGTYAKGRYFVGDLSRFEILQLTEAGLSFEILIEDVEAWYADPDRREISLRDPLDCQPVAPVLNYPVPENFETGSMGGYFTWQEMLAILDEMKSLFPDLISTKQAIGEELSYEGRPIHWVRISDNPDMDENEPEVLYTALHHAREPGSLTQLIFYMWYLLENYDTDDQVRFLIENTEMYFIPCVNPDGYVYNQVNNPEGGGLWRKTRVENGDGSHGVDINRNYGYQWGYDNEGSSENPLSETYRGSGAFSEPETRAVRDFCNDHQFQIALNYHTHGDLLVHPWSYSNSYTPDHETFSQMARALTAENQYRTGITSETVGYEVNGDSDDWMYGDTDAKPAIFSFTPEVGSSGGFWPAEDQIIPNCQKTMLMNLNTAALVHRFGVLNDINSTVINNSQTTFYYTLRRIGLQAGSLEVNLIPISDNVLIDDGPQSHELELNELVEGAFPITLDPGIQNGDTILLYLSLNTGAYAKGDTLSKIFIHNPPTFFSSCDNLEGWNVPTGNWSVIPTDYFSAPSSITDSPNGVYSNNVADHIELDQSVLLDGTFQKAMLNFRAKWAIEPEYDYAQVAISVNGNEYIPLCGSFSKPGTNYQDEGNPIYDGFQQEWVEETIDITEYVEQGDQVNIRFSMVTDGYLQEDGFYFDDVRILLSNNEVNATLQPSDFIYWQLYPSPASDFLNLEIKPDNHANVPLEIAIYNALGKIICSEKTELSGPYFKSIATSHWEPGFYICKITLGSRMLPIKPIIITH